MDSPPDGLQRPDEPIFMPQSIELIDPRHPEEPILAPPRRRPRNRKRIALILFALTCLSTFLVGALGNGFLPSPWALVAIWSQIQHEGLATFSLRGLSYAGPVMLILLFHEMGHYLQARRYHVPASLPYFIPMPLTFFGTMGAVIVQSAGYPNRKSLFDIAVSGPLAGLVLAIPIAWIGVLNSSVVTVVPGAAAYSLGDPLVLQWMVRAVHGPLAENQDVLLNPMLFAGWVGIFITALNLIPIGQLDGGHILYALVGRRAHTIAVTLLWGAVAYMVLSGDISYILIVILLIIFGPRHPASANDAVPLGRGRTILGWLTLAFILIGFTPTPLRPSVPSEQRPPTPIERPRDTAQRGLRPQPHGTNPSPAFVNDCSEYGRFPQLQAQTNGGRPFPSSPSVRSTRG